MQLTNLEREAVVSAISDVDHWLDGRFERKLGVGTPVWFNIPWYRKLIERNDSFIEIIVDLKSGYDLTRRQAPTPVVVEEVSATTTLSALLRRVFG